MKKIILKTKRGGASMFIVMFTVIILSIITLSFTRLILAEALKTSNTDLSQSAYDSALAGVEDAKIALLKYHACLDNGNTASSGTAECKKIIKAMQDGIAKRDCSTISNVLGREANSSTENSVVVQETSTSNKEGNNTNMLQAYTCVTIKEELEDYRTTLNSQSRLRIIPIRSSEIDKIGYLRLKWFSSTNKQQVVNAKNKIKFCADTKNELSPILYSAGSCNGVEQAPTTLMARIIQTDETFNISELSATATVGDTKKAENTNTGSLLFVPTDKGDGTNYVDKATWGKSANKADNPATKVNCNKDNEWLCYVDIQIPNTFKNGNRSDSNTYLLVSIPYGNPETDISVMTFVESDPNAGQGNITKTDSDHNLVNQRDFTGVQARIDSTGRANDLYRRVETRVELVDTFFAYPEFEITLTDSGSDTLNKTFYATFNCWSANNGSGPIGCDNSYEDFGFTSF